MKKLELSLIITLFLFPLTLNAYYPSTIWSSDRIDDTLVGVRTGNVVGDGREDIVALSRNHLFVYRVFENQMFKIMDHKGSGREEWIKLALFDLDGDGVSEIIVSGFYAGKVTSFIGRISGKKFKKIVEAPFYLRSIFWEGREILVSQKSLGGDDFTGSLFEMSWNGKELEEKRQIKLPGGISTQSISIYSIAGIDVPGKNPGFLYLSPSGKLLYYRENSKKYKKIWNSGQTYGGDVYYLDREIRNVLNQVEEKRFFVPVSFYADKSEPGRPLSVYLIKNEGYLKNVIGAVPSVKSAQMIRLVWTGYGFQEEWNSPRLDGAISDFTLFDWDGDGKKEILAAFLLRDKGYVDTLKRQDSLLIVIDMK